jgi:hypothetical protein
LLIPRLFEALDLSTAAYWIQPIQHTFATERQDGALGSVAAGLAEERSFRWSFLDLNYRSMSLIDEKCLERAKHSWCDCLLSDFERHHKQASKRVHPSDSNRMLKQTSSK